MKDFVFRLARYLESEEPSLEPLPAIAEQHTETREQTMERVALVMLAAENQQQTAVVATNKCNEHSFFAPIWAHFRQVVCLVRPRCAERAARETLLRQKSTLVNNEAKFHPTQREQQLMLNFDSTMSSLRQRDHVYDALMFGSGVYALRCWRQVFSVAKQSSLTSRLSFGIPLAIAGALFFLVRRYHPSRLACFSLHQMCRNLYDE